MRLRMECMPYYTVMGVREAVCSCSQTVWCASEYSSVAVRLSGGMCEHVYVVLQPHRSLLCAQKPSA